MPAAFGEAVGLVEADVDQDTALLLTVKSREYRRAMIVMELYGF
jgi:hypothetical protein